MSETKESDATHGVPGQDDEFGGQIAAQPRHGWLASLLLRSTALEYSMTGKIWAVCLLVLALSPVRGPSCACDVSALLRHGTPHAAASARRLRRVPMTLDDIELSVHERPVRGRGPG